LLIVDWKNLPFDHFKNQKSTIHTRHSLGDSAAGRINWVAIHRLKIRRAFR
jgi:hypothetical protein